MSTSCAACGAPLAPGADRCPDCGTLSPHPPAPVARRAPVRPVLEAVAEITPQTVAPVGRRVLAFTIDVLVLVLAAGAGYAIARASGGLRQSDGSWRIPALAVPGLLVLTALVQLVGEAGSGATVGNGLTGIRTMGARTRRPAGLASITVRVLVELAGALVALLGAWVVAASGVWDRSPGRRGWHDKAARTVVLRARSVREAAVEGPGAAPAVARALGPVPDRGLVRPAPGVIAPPRAAPTSVGTLIAGAPGLVRPTVWTRSPVGRRRARRAHHRPARDAPSQARNCARGRPADRRPQPAGVRADGAGRPRPGHRRAGDRGDRRRRQVAPTDPASAKDRGAVDLSTGRIVGARAPSR